MNGLPDRGLEQSALVEAELELKQRIVRSADAAAEVEALVAVRLRPAGSLQEKEVVGAACALGGAEVVVEPRRAREAEQRGAQAAGIQRLEEHEPGAVRERLPVLVGEVVEAGRALLGHRPLVEPGKRLEVGRPDGDARLDPGGFGLTRRSTVVPVEPVEEIALVEPPRDGASPRLDVEARVAVIRKARVEPGERRDDPVVAAPLLVGVVDAGVADGAAEAVRPRDVAGPVELAEDAREDRGLEPQEHRPAGVEHRGGLDVLAA